MRLNNNSGNSLLLAAVKLVTTLNSILITMILSKTLSLTIYGTYAQGVLIVSLATSLSIFGLNDATNYFFNHTLDPVERERYIRHIYTLCLISGGAVGLLILAFAQPISAYFSNAALLALIPLLAFRPLFANLTLTLQVLHVAIGQSRVIVVRNLAISTLHLVIVAAVSLTTKNLTTIFAIYLALDAALNGLLLASLSRFGYKLTPIRLSLSRVKDILCFSLPMAAYVVMNTVMREMDKLVIGRMESTEALAIYNNCGKILPFDFISASFLTILIPVVTRYIGQKDTRSAREVFKAYLKMGCASTWIVTTAVLLCSTEAIRFLYSDAYLPGKTVFILYIIVEMIKFANVSLVLSASGKTKTLMTISFAGLVANLVLNIAFYYIFGFIGPAVSTVMITLLTVIVLTQISAKTLDCSLVSLVDFRFLGSFVLKLVLCAAVSMVLHIVMAGNHPTVVLFTVAGVFCALSAAVNRKEIVSIIHMINGFR